MNIKEKLVENTILALQGKLTESNNWTYKPTSNSYYAYRSSKRAKFNSEEYIDNVYRSNPNYELYETALQKLDRAVTFEGMFIEDVQINTFGKYGLIGLYAIIKNDVTKNMQFSSNTGSGDINSYVFIQVNDNKEVGYYFEVYSPKVVKVSSKGEPSEQLIKSIKTYLLIFGTYALRDDISDKIKDTLPNISISFDYGDGSPYYVKIEIEQYETSTNYESEVYIIANEKNYTYTFKFKDNQYQNMDDVIKAIQNDYNTYISNFNSI